MAACSVLAITKVSLYVFEKYSKHMQACGYLCHIITHVGSGTQCLGGPGDPDTGALWCFGRRIYRPRASCLVELRSGERI